MGAMQKGSGEYSIVMKGVLRQEKRRQRGIKTHVNESSEREETLRRSPAGKNPARQSMEPCSHERVMRRQSPAAVPAWASASQRGRFSRDEPTRMSGLVQK